MKVLVVTNLFPTPWDLRRGAFNRQQFQRLGERHDVHVLTAVDFRERKGPARHVVRVPGVVARHFTFWHPPGIGRFLNALCFLLCVLWQHGRRLRSEGYDVLLASWAFPDAVAGGWLARWLGIPYLAKVHGSDLNIQAEATLRRPQVRHALQQAGMVITVSRALADKAAALGVSPERIVTLYNGVDTRLFQPGDRIAARRRLGLPPEVPIVLYVGNLKASKGCHDLIRAFPTLVTRHHDARLVYVGDGPDRTSLESLASTLCSAPAVRFAGAADHAALVDWFRAADVLCLPSHNEGVPNVVLEAMACGTPVVATAVGGIPEILPAHAGILVPPHEPRELALALVASLDRHYDNAAIAAHAAGFRWDDNIDRLEQALAQVLGEARAHLRANA